MFIVKKLVIIDVNAWTQLFVNSVKSSKNQHSPIDSANKWWYNIINKRKELLKQVSNSIPSKKSNSYLQRQHENAYYKQSKLEE